VKTCLDRTLNLRDKFNYDNCRRALRQVAILAVNYPEIALQTAIIVMLLLGVAMYAKYRLVPKLRAEAGVWAGNAIGRFWQTLSEKAEGEGGSPGEPGKPLKILGMEITPELLQTVMGLIQWAQQMGFLKAGPASGGENPFLK